MKYSHLITYVILILSFISSPLVSAQKSGLKVGSNISWCNHSSFIGKTNISPGIGFNVGYIKQWKIKTKIKLHSEVSLSNYNYTLQNEVTENELDLVHAVDPSWNSNIYNSKSNLKGYYIELPIGISYSLFDRFHLGGGYQLGYNLFEFTNDIIGPSWSHSIYGALTFCSKIGDIVFAYKHGLNEDSIAETRKSESWETIITSGKIQSLQLTFVIPF